MKSEREVLKNRIADTRQRMNHVTWKLRALNYPITSTDCQSMTRSMKRFLDDVIVVEAVVDVIKNMLERQIRACEKTIQELEAELHAWHNTTRIIPYEPIPSPAGHDPNST